MTPTPEPRCYALVPCAGIGARAGADGPKQYVELAGRAMVAHTLAALARVERLVATLVVLAPDDLGFEQAAPDFLGPRAWVARCGGPTRAATVAQGLTELAARGAHDDDWVLVHDAARCLIRPAAVDRLIDACWHDPVGGLLAVPLADTLKSEDGGRVIATVPRDGKWAAQTPQMFRLGLLRQALAAPHAGQTDDASAIEALGHRPRMVAGDVENFKLTWPADFALAERLLPGPQIKAFVPARDFGVSMRFYAELGFDTVWANEKLAHLRLGPTAFLLQDFDAPGLSANLMMHLVVDDLDRWWARIDAGGLAARYGVRCGAPAARPWGQRDLELFDPSGVLWRIAQRKDTP